MKTIPGAVPAITFGIGVHATKAVYSDIAGWMAILKARRMTTVRFDLTSADDTTPAALLDSLLTYSVPYGIALHPVIYIPFTFTSNKTDSGRYPNTDAGVYQSAYDRTYALVSVYGDRVRDWAFQNELTLLSGFKTGNGPSSSDYASALAASWQQGYKGFSDAIAAVQAAHPSWGVRRVAGIVGVDFGFIAFLQATGAVVDKVSYHYYYDRRTVPTSLFFTGGPYNLWSQLAAIGKPVIIDEFNAAEVYTSTIEDSSFSSLCMARHLEYIISQTTCTIEGIEAYELFDEPSLSAPENRFGLMVDASTLKNRMLLYASWAGAYLSAAEYTSLQSAATAWRMT